MTQTAESPRGAKSLHVYKNGDPFDKGHRVVYNDKQTRNFDSFLNDLTSVLRAPFGAVRRLYTPEQGHRVDDLTSIQSGKKYVAAGLERFKKVGYMSQAMQNGPRGPQRQRPLPPPGGNQPPNGLLLNFRMRPAVVASARHLKVVFEPIRIYVFTNGNELMAAQQFLFSRRQLEQGWEHVLDSVSKKIVLNSGAVKKLYRMDGSRCADLEDLKKDEYYVAAGAERFKNVPYGITQGRTSIWNTSPRLERRGVTLPPIGQTSKQERRAYNSRAVIRSRNPSDRDRGDVDQSDQKSEKSNQSVQSLPNNRNPRVRQNQTFVGYERQRTRAKKPSETDASAPPQQQQQGKQQQQQQQQQQRQQRQREESQKEKFPEKAAEAGRNANAGEQRTAMSVDADMAADSTTRQPTKDAEATKEDLPASQDRDERKEEEEEEEEEGSMTKRSTEGVNFYAQPKQTDGKSSPDKEILLQATEATDANSVFYSKSEETKEEEEEEVEETEETKVDIPVDLQADEEVEEEEEVGDEKTEDSAAAAAAATKIQASYRGYSTRKNLSAERQKNNADDDNGAAAAEVVADENNED